MEVLQDTVSTVMTNCLLITAINEFMFSGGINQIDLDETFNWSL